MTGPTNPVAEGQQAAFTLRLSSASRVPQRVTVTTTPGTATYGVDYFAPVKQTILFAPGQTSQTFSIATLRDAVSDRAEGRETFTVVASPENRTLGPARSQVVTIIDTAGPTPISKFQISLNYVTTAQGDVPANVRAACAWAAERWSQIIVGDLPDVRLSGGKVIDDIVINVQMGLLAPDVNGPGGAFANAAPTAFRSGSSGLPYEAQTGIDPFDVGTPQLRSLLLHEFGHALGIGTMWASKSLTLTPTPDNPTYIGRNAVREFNRIFGVTGTSVPLENTGTGGEFGVHWRESVMDAELMTRRLEAAGVAMPLSTITVGALQDLGYDVSYLKADFYAKPRGASGVPAPVRRASGGSESGGGVAALSQAFSHAFAAIADGAELSAKPRSSYRRSSGA